MCGICGIVRNDTAPIDKEQLKRMNEAITHRGPDGDGYYYENGVGLAMRRLAIIDVSGGDQPITNEDESLWIVYNGEVYNFPHLRKQLESQGHVFRTHTDTECILHLYEEYGDDCVNYLRGMFAFSLWDNKRKRLLIARDRMGQKPLYYTKQAGNFYFGSELPSILAVLPQRPNISHSAIDLYLSLQYIPEPHTPYEGIHKLPPAHRLIWQDGEIRIERYWDLNYGPKLEDSEEDLIVELGSRLRQAVYMRMISEVPLGAHLSGGIDSSVIVALMSEFSSEPVKTFSVGFEETAFSELPFARSVAERYQTDHHEFILSFGDIPTTLEKILQHVGEPFADPSALPLFHLADLTRQHVTVALNGDGGDEAFGGYQRYWWDAWANRYMKLPRFITRKIVPAFAKLLPQRVDLPIGSSVLNGLSRLEQVAAISKKASIYRWGSYFSGELKDSLWRSDIVQELEHNAAEQYLIDIYDMAQADNFLDKTLYVDNNAYLPGDLLVKADRMAMAHSLEGRSPFLDHELASWAARLPLRYKTRGLTGKYLLRKAFADLLPEEITRRGKQGFGIPVGAWFKGPLAAWSREILLASGSGLEEWFNREALTRILDEHKSGSVNHGKRIYALVMLAMWKTNL